MITPVTDEDIDEIGQAIFSVSPFISARFGRMESELRSLRAVADAARCVLLAYVDGDNEQIALGAMDAALRDAGRQT